MHGREWDGRVPQPSHYCEVSRGMREQGVVGGAFRFGTCLKYGRGFLAAGRMAVSCSFFVSPNCDKGGEQCLSFSGAKWSLLGRCCHASGSLLLHHRVFGRRPRPKLPAITARSITTGAAAISLLLYGLRRRWRRPARRLPLHSKSTL